MVTVTATLDGAARAAATDVALAATGGTAVAVTDFAAVTGVTVTIPAQQLTGTATFRFSPVNDNLDEGLSETVILGGTVAGLTVRPATLTIADDDGKGIELSRGPGDADRGRQRDLYGSAGDAADGSGDGAGDGVGRPGRDGGAGIAQLRADDLGDGADGDGARGA